MSECLGCHQLLEQEQHSQGHSTSRVQCVVAQHAAQQQSKRTGGEDCQRCAAAHMLTLSQLALLCSSLKPTPDVTSEHMQN